ncbi:response regulator [Methylomarinum sp. Ch1-1]|uniref:Response regulator n=1 Tax=Methylomarinum roseum TaxID=3067653 RepID=A0AAU7NSW2_9GAMM
MHSVNISDLSILLIEPSKTQLKVIVKHLNEQGVSRIDGVATGEAALEKLTRHQCDLVISSLYLPDMMATELVDRVKNTEAFKEIPFMLISSETRFAVLDEIRQAGVVAILPKPFDRADLKRALRATIDFIDPREMELEHYDVESIRVLVVDDSNLARKHITRVLSNMGIRQIHQAADGKEALQIFEQAQQSFDLIVTDYNMPEMDGRELIQAIRDELHNAYIPILMVTSEQNEARLSNIQRAGVSAICDKPFEPQTVKEMLYRVLEEG